MILTKYTLVKRQEMETDQKIIDLVSEENEILREKIITAENLFRECLPYIEFHFARARFSEPSKRLIDLIKKFIGD